MVTPFLVIRSIALVVLTVIYIYLGQDMVESAGIINAALVGITSVVVYTGLVLIGFAKDWQPQADPISQVDFQGNGAGPGFADQDWHGKENYTVTVETE